MSSRVFYRRPVLIQWLRKRFPDVPWEEVEPELPPIIWRHKWNALADRVGLPYKQGYLENLDSQGQGPAQIQKGGVAMLQNNSAPAHGNERGQKEISGDGIQLIKSKEYVKSSANSQGLSDMVSLFRGAKNPKPFSESTWQDQIQNIIDGKHKQIITELRGITDTEEYKREKQKLLGVRIIESGENNVEYRLEGTQASAVPTYAVFFDEEVEGGLVVRPVMWFEIIRKISANREDSFLSLPMGLVDNEGPESLKHEPGYLALTHDPDPDHVDFKCKIDNLKKGWVEPIIVTKVPKK